MAQAGPSIVSATYHGDEEGSGSVREAKSGVACDLYVTASTSTVTSHQACEYETARMSEEQIKAAIEMSRGQGWSELAHGGQASAAGSSSHDQETRVIWAELKRRYPRTFKDMGEEVELGREANCGGRPSPHLRILLVWT